MNKISKLLFAAWLAICCVAVANAENSLTVFDSTQVSPYVPLPTASYNEAGTRGQVIYPAAVMKNSANPAAAQAFLDYLTGDEAMAVFEGVGFSRA